MADPSHAATLARRVTNADTAERFGAGFPPAASTPFVLGLAEVACHNAVVTLLTDGQITVGTSAHVDHLAPTPVGETLTATATLRRRDERRLEFDVEVHDGRALVARITHNRAIVDRQRMLDRLAR
jgi:fluoroacetyl-CoA thioesterase